MKTSITIRGLLRLVVIATVFVLSLIINSWHSQIAVSDENAPISTLSHAQDTDALDQQIQPFGTTTNIRQYYNYYWLRTPGEGCSSYVCTINGVYDNGNMESGIGFKIGTAVGGGFNHMDATRPIIFVKFSSVIALKNTRFLQVGSCDATYSNEPQCIKFGDYSFDIIGIRNTMQKTGICKLTATDGYLDNSGEECPPDSIALFLSNQSVSHIGNNNHYADLSDSTANQYSKSLLKMEMDNGYLTAKDSCFGSLSSCVDGQKLSGVALSRNLAGGAKHNAKGGNKIAGADVMNAYMFPLSYYEASNIVNSDTPVYQLPYKITYSPNGGGNSGVVTQNTDDSGIISTIYDYADAQFTFPANSSGFMYWCKTEPTGTPKNICPLEDRISAKQTNVQFSSDTTLYACWQMNATFDFSALVFSDKEYDGSPLFTPTSGTIALGNGYTLVNLNSITCSYAVLVVPNVANDIDLYAYCSFTKDKIDAPRFKLPLREDQIASPIKKVNIIPRSLMVNELSAKDKTYDGTTDVVIVPGSGYSSALSNIVTKSDGNLDDVQLDSCTGQYADPHAEENKVVSTYSCTIKGASSSNYVIGSYYNQQLENNPLKGTIKQLRVTVKARDLEVSINESIPNIPVNYFTVSPSLFAGDYLQGSTVYSSDPECQDTTAMKSVAGCIIEDPPFSAGQDYLVTFKRGALIVSDRPSAPQIEIDYINEKLIGFNSSINYCISEMEHRNSCNETVLSGNKDITESMLGKTYNIWYYDTNSIRSILQTITIPFRPTMPQLGTVDAHLPDIDDGRFYRVPYASGETAIRCGDNYSGLVDRTTACNFEYRLSTDTQWKQTESRPDARNLPPGEYFVRVEPSNTTPNFKSEYSIVVIGRVKKTVTISGTFTAKNKEYDGTTFAELDSNDLYVDDLYSEYSDVAVEITSLSFTDPNVNTAAVVGRKNIVVANTVKLTGNDAQYYEIEDYNPIQTYADITQRQWHIYMKDYVAIVGENLIDSEWIDGSVVHHLQNFYTTIDRLLPEHKISNTVIAKFNNPSICKTDVPSDGIDDCVLMRSTESNIITDNLENDVSNNYLTRPTIHSGKLIVRPTTVTTTPPDLGTCSLPQYNNQVDCEAGGGTWTPGTGITITDPTGDCVVPPSSTVQNVTREKCDELGGSFTPNPQLPGNACVKSSELVRGSAEFTALDNEITTANNLHKAWDIKLVNCNTNAIIDLNRDVNVKIPNAGFKDAITPFTLWHKHFGGVNHDRPEAAEKQAGTRTGNDLKDLTFTTDRLSYFGYSYLPRDPSGTCSIAGLTNQTDCEAGGGTWTVNNPGGNQPGNGTNPSSGCDANGQNCGIPGIPGGGSNPSLTPPDGIPGVMHPIPSGGTYYDGSDGGHYYVAPNGDVYKYDPATGTWVLAHTGVDFFMLLMLLLMLTGAGLGVRYGVRCMRRDYII